MIGYFAQFLSIITAILLGSFCNGSEKSSAIACMHPFLQDIQEKSHFDPQTKNLINPSLKKINFRDIIVIAPPAIKGIYLTQDHIEKVIAATPDERASLKILKSIVPKNSATLSAEHMFYTEKSQEKQFALLIDSVNKNKPLMLPWKEIWQPIYTTSKNNKEFTVTAKKDLSSTALYYAFLHKEYSAIKDITETNQGALGQLFARYTPQQALATAKACFNICIDHDIQKGAISCLSEIVNYTLKNKASSEDKENCLKCICNYVMNRARTLAKEDKSTKINKRLQMIFKKAETVISPEINDFAKICYWNTYARVYKNFSYFKKTVELLEKKGKDSLSHEEKIALIAGYSGLEEVAPLSLADMFKIPNFSVLHIDVAIKATCLFDMIAGPYECYNALAEKKLPLNKEVHQHVILAYLDYYKLLYKKIKKENNPANAALEKEAFDEISSADDKLLKLIPTKEPRHFETLKNTIAFWNENGNPVLAQHYTILMEKKLNIIKNLAIKNSQKLINNAQTIQRTINPDDVSLLSVRSSFEKKMPTPKNTMTLFKRASERLNEDK